MNRLLNLNADLGESFGPWSMGSDAEMLGIVGSANVACGYHAGDPLVMTSTAALALKLDGRARHRAIGTEHAAVPHLRAQRGAATLALVEELAGVGRHLFDLAVSAVRTGDFGVKLRLHRRYCAPAQCLRQ